MRFWKQLKPVIPSYGISNYCWDVIEQHRTFVFLIYIREMVCVSQVQIELNWFEEFQFLWIRHCMFPHTKPWANVTWFGELFHVLSKFSGNIQNIFVWFDIVTFSSNKDRINNPTKQFLKTSSEIRYWWQSNIIVSLIFRSGIYSYISTVLKRCKNLLRFNVSITKPINLELMECVWDHQYLPNGQFAHVRDRKSNWFYQIDFVWTT